MGGGVDISSFSEKQNSSQRETFVNIDKVKKKDLTPQHY
jgi:hypothetical protein